MCHWEHGGGRRVTSSGHDRQGLYSLRVFILTGKDGNKQTHGQMYAGWQEVMSAVAEPKRVK